MEREGNKKEIRSNEADLNMLTSPKSHTIL